MSDHSDTVDDSKKGPLDDSCMVEFIEIVPLDRAFDDYNPPECIRPVFVVNPENLPGIHVKVEAADKNYNEVPNYPVKQEPADEYETEDPCINIQVSLTDMKDF